MSDSNHLDDLRMQVRYRRERLALYRAKVHGPSATSPLRLAELKRAYELSVSHLKRASEAAAGSRSS